MEYRFRQGFHRQGLDPQQIGEILQQLQDERGGLINQSDVVDEASTSEYEAFRDYFEWDDEIAGEEYRFVQAGQLLRSVIIVREDSPIEEEKTIRAFVNVQTSTARGYADIIAVMSDTDLRRQVVRRAFRELRAWRDKYEELMDFAEVFEAIERLENQADAA